MELISKYDVIKALQKWNCRDYESLTINPYEVLRDIPTKEERKEGKWVFDEKGYFFCSECKVKPNSQYATTDYCPNCGAKMIGE
jgi:hypothetical protein